MKESRELLREKPEKKRTRFREKTEQEKRKPKILIPKWLWIVAGCLLVLMVVRIVVDKVSESIFP